METTAAVNFYLRRFTFTVSGIHGISLGKPPRHFALFYRQYSITILGNFFPYCEMESDWNELRSSLDFCLLMKVKQKKPSKTLINVFISLFLVFICNSINLLFHLRSLLNSIQKQTQLISLTWENFKTNMNKAGNKEKIENKNMKIMNGKCSHFPI